MAKKRVAAKRKTRRLTIEQKAVQQLAEIQDNLVIADDGTVTVHEGRDLFEGGVVE